VGEYTGLIKPILLARRPCEIADLPYNIDCCDSHCVSVTVKTCCAFLCTWDLIGRSTPPEVSEPTNLPERDFKIFPAPLLFIVVRAEDREKLIFRFGFSYYSFNIFVRSDIK
jgi:hypothetical protein